MDEHSLRSAFEARKPMLAAWGSEVCESIVSGLRSTLTAEKPIEVFLKIWPPTSRVKGTNSFVRKALYRSKPYVDPLAQITDPVGARFVTLLADEIQLVETVVSAQAIWTFEKSRDFEEERQVDPLVFAYQSVHYVVMAKDEHTFNGVTVAAKTPCEIQIRTLLQHAYSELSHDAFYKPTMPGVADNPVLRREVARSMALIETTDLIFSNVMKSISSFTDDLRRPVREAASVYEREIGPLEAIDFRLSDFVLASYRPLLTTVTEEAIRAFLAEKPHVAEFIRERAKASAFFAHPLSLLVTMFIEQEPSETVENWPLDPEMLTPIFSQLGIATP